MPPRRRARNPGPSPEALCGRLYQDINEWSHLGPYEILEVSPDSDIGGDHILIETEGPSVRVRCTLFNRGGEEDDDE